VQLSGRELALHVPSSQIPSTREKQQKSLPAYKIGFIFANETLSWKEKELLQTSTKFLLCASYHGKCIRLYNV
jgi:hypothetical protein